MERNRFLTSFSTFPTKSKEKKQHSVCAIFFAHSMSPTLTLQTRAIFIPSFPYSFLNFSKSENWIRSSEEITNRSTGSSFSIIMSLENTTALLFAMSWMLWIILLVNLSPKIKTFFFSFFMSSIFRLGNC